MNSDLADAQEVKAAEESAWEILTGFSLPKYAVDSLTHYKNNPESFKNEVLSGITVAVMQVPESVAFSFVAGVPPLVGLYSTFFLGFITAVIGGKEGMISGAAGAMAVVIKDLMADSGPLSDYSKGDRFNHLLMTVLVCGILQTLCGLFQLAKLVKLISKPCMVGFMNGLGIVIFYAQFGAFKKCPYAKATAPESPDYFSDCKENERRWMELGGEDAAKTWLTLLSAWKSTSELGYAETFVILHAIEQRLLRGQRRIDGVESPRRRAEAATEARRVDGVGRPKFDVHTGCC